MKKFAFFFVLAAMMLALGCEKEINTDVMENGNDEFITYSFTAANVDDETLRSTLANNGIFSWVVGDKIAIYNSKSSSYVEFEVKSVDGSGNSTIQASAAPGAVWTNAIYPAERATGAGNAVDYTVSSVAGPILVSQVDGQTLSFKYLGSVINLTVTGVPDTPATLTFTANANVFGSRTFSWVSGAPVLGGSGSTASITVPFNASGITTLPVPKEDYAGFTITVDNAAGRHLYKKTTAHTFTLATSDKILLPMDNLAYAAPSKYYVTTSSTSGYWDKSNVRMIQTGANTYGVQMNCDGGTDIYIFDEYNLGNETIGYLNKGHVDGGNFYEISWDTSTSSGGPNYISATRDYPFYHSSHPVNGMYLLGSFNSWGTSNPFTYNGNMHWTAEGLVISANNSYEFKIAASDWNYSAGIYSGLGSSSLYGSLKGDTGNASVTLAAGTYNVYLNATSDWYYNIMFEKQ